MGSMEGGTGLELVTISVNDIEVQVPKGEIIAESVKRLGLELPIFCYHPRMKPVGMCRMCLIEVGFKQPDGSIRKMPKPQAGCTLPATEGMAIYTDTEPLHRDRKGVLEFLLVNHPLDCPICDRGGECPLQNNTVFYGPSTSRFIEMKRHQPKAFPLSKYVTLDLERCIQCGRCVRFTEEISGDAQLAFRFRGAGMQPSTFELTDFNSKFSGNVIEICPVGALTSSQYRFRSRPWDLETRPAICLECSNGCNVWFDYRPGKFVRINGRTHEGINEEWTCDRGKFGHDYYNNINRPTRPRIRKDGRLVECSWSEAYDAILEGCKDHGHRVAGLIRPSFSNEGLYLMKRAFEEIFGSRNIDYRWTSQLPTQGPHPVTQIAKLEAAANIAVVCTHLADELPMIYLRIRKGWQNLGATVVQLNSARDEVDQFASATAHYRAGSEYAAVEALASLLQVPLTPPIDVNASCLANGIDVDRLTAVAGAIKSGTEIVTSDSLLNTPDADRTLRLLQAIAEHTGSNLSLYPRAANEFGAAMLGIGSGSDQKLEPTMGTQGILKRSADGTIQALWCVDADPIELCDRNKAEQALETVPFLVVCATRQSPILDYASVVLPMALPAEGDGSYTNCEGRVQRMKMILQPRDETKAAWRIFAELLLRATPSSPFFNPGEVMDEIAARNSGFANSTYDKLNGEGAFVQFEASSKGATG